MSTRQRPYQSDEFPKAIVFKLDNVVFKDHGANKLSREPNISMNVFRKEETLTFTTSVVLCAAPVSVNVYRISITPSSC